MVEAEKRDPPPRGDKRHPSLLNMVKFPPLCENLITAGNSPRIYPIGQSRPPEDTGRSDTPGGAIAAASRPSVVN